MGLIIKQDVLSCIVNERQLQKLDFTKEESFLPLKSIAIGIAAEGNIIQFFYINVHIETMMSKDF